MNVASCVIATLALCLAGIASAEPKCTKAELFAGNPQYAEPQERPREGQALRDDPPLPWRSLVFVGSKLVSNTGQEVWYTDLSAAKPVLKRLAGKENPTGRSVSPGRCTEARFANIFGLAAFPDGHLAGADQTGNSVFAIKDPFSPGCTVDLIAGTTKATEGVSPSSPPNLGDLDGPGASARFKLPQWPALIGQDIFVIDEGNGKVKKVGGDTAHTVKTIAKLPEGVYYAMVALNGKLYVVGNQQSEAFIVEIDPTAGSVRDVVKGPSGTFDSQGSINISGLATDGTDLFTTHSGKVLSVTPGGQVKTIAGSGVYFDFRSPYDYTKPQKASEVQLVATRRLSTAGSNVFLAYQEGALYVSASRQTAYVEKIDCK